MNRRTESERAVSDSGEKSQLRIRDFRRVSDPLSYFWPVLTKSSFFSLERHCGWRRWFNLVYGGRKGWLRAEGDDSSYIMGLRRRIYFSSIRASHIGRATRGPGQEVERKESPGYSTSRTWYASLTNSPFCNENRPASRTTSRPSCNARASVKFLYVFTGRNWVSSVIYRNLDDWLKKDREFPSRRLDATSCNGNRHCGFRCDQRRDKSNL